MYILYINILIQLQENRYIHIHMYLIMSMYIRYTYHVYVNNFSFTIMPKTKKRLESDSDSGPEDVSYILQCHALTDNSFATHVTFHNFLSSVLHRGILSRSRRALHQMTEELAALPEWMVPRNRLGPSRGCAMSRFENSRESSMLTSESSTRRTEKRCQERKVYILSLTLQRLYWPFKFSSKESLWLRHSSKSWRQSFQKLMPSWRKCKRI